MLKHVSGLFVRRLAPRSVAALEEVADLRAQLAELRAELDRTRAECAELRAVRADVSRLDGRVEQLDADLAESRRLSLRVGQLSDLVFDRLADRPAEAREPTASG